MVSSSSPPTYHSGHYAPSWRSSPSIWLTPLPETWVLAGSNELHDKVLSTSMRGILLLAVLSVKSSYSREEETPLESAEDTPDTLQWWFGEGGCWRIRTYTLDHWRSCISDRKFPANNGGTRQEKQSGQLRRPNRDAACDPFCGLLQSGGVGSWIWAYWFGAPAPIWPQSVRILEARWRGVFDQVLTEVARAHRLPMTERCSAFHD